MFVVVDGSATVVAVETEVVSVACSVVAVVVGVAGVVDDALLSSCRELTRKNN